MKLSAGKALVVAVTTALAVGCGQQAAVQTATNGNVSATAVATSQTGRYVAVFKNEKLPADVAARVQRAGGKVLKQIDAIGTITFRGTTAAAAKLGADSTVLAVSPERYHRLPEGTQQTPEAIQVPTPATDPYLPYQWDMRRINAPAVWARLDTTIQDDATVAILDSGVMHTHPDLAGKFDLLTGTNYCQEAGPNGSTAYPIYTKWIDFDTEISGDAPCTTTPDTMYNTHGTHVAGTVGAKVGGGGVVGVGPGLRLAAYKVFDRIHVTEGEEEIDDIAGFDGPIWTAIIDASLRGFDVINMSLGSTAYRNNKEDNASIVAWNRVVKLADRLGTVIVSSAGNDAEDANGPATHIPGDLPSIINVSATGSSNLVPMNGLLVAAPGSDVVAFYSNYGAAVDISAPGGDCGPTYPKACAAQYLILNAGITEDGATAGTPTYYFMAGTSMAAPHVAGVAGLVKALHPDWNPGQVRSHLKSTAEQVGDRQLFGHGIVNADAAVR